MLHFIICIIIIQSTHSSTEPFADQIQAAPSIIVNVSGYNSIVDYVISHSSLVIFGKTHCPFTQLAKEVLKPYEPVIIDVNTEDRFHFTIDEYQSYLSHKTGMHPITWPTIFINNQCVGGCTEILHLKENGELNRLINASTIEYQSISSRPISPISADSTNLSANAAGIEQAVARKAARSRRESLIVIILSVLLLSFIGMWMGLKG